MKNVWQLCDNPPKPCEAIADLYHWSTNYDHPTPFALLLDIIGYSDEHFGEPMFDMKKISERIGYLEASQLGKALIEYANNPNYVYLFVEKLMDAESEG